MTDQPPVTEAPAVAPDLQPGTAPRTPADTAGASKVIAPYVLALGCLAAVVFDPGLRGSADTVLKLLLGAALMAINPGARPAAPR